MQSKMRLSRKGYAKSPKTGYGAPSSLRHTTPDGKRVVIVHRTRELESLGEESVIIISSGVGNRNRAAILSAAEDKGLRIANRKNPKKWLESIEAELKKKKVLKKKEEEKEKKEKPHKKKKPAEELTGDELKDKEKKEKDKVLTKPK